MMDSAGLLSLQRTVRSENIKISPVHVMKAPAAVGMKTLPIECSADDAERDLAWDLHA